MSGKESRARRVEAVKLGRSDAIQKLECKPEQFKCPRQRRIYQQYYQQQATEMRSYKDE